MAQGDQRKKKRVSMIATAVIRKDQAGPPIEAYIINVSHGGLGMYLKEPLSGRVQIAISLRVGVGKRVTETIWGQVTWEKSVGTWHAIGVAFEGLNAGDHSVLLSFLDDWHSFDEVTQREIHPISSPDDEKTLT